MAYNFVTDGGHCGRTPGMPRELELTVHYLNVALDKMAEEECEQLEDCMMGLALVGGKAPELAAAYAVC